MPLLGRFPPPLFFALTFLGGVGLQRLAPIPAFSPGLAVIARLLGLALVGAGVLLALACAGLFFSKRTTIIPFGTASTLVTSGPYRFTRNPMYVSLVTIYLGVAGILALAWPLALLLLPVAVVSMAIIPFEEARLREVFGDTYVQYCGRVRRWV